MLREVLEYVAGRQRKRKDFILNWNNFAHFMTTHHFQKCPLNMTVHHKCWIYWAEYIPLEHWIILQNQCTFWHSWQPLLRKAQSQISIATLFALGNITGTFEQRKLIFSEATAILSITSFIFCGGMILTQFISVKLIQENWGSILCSSFHRRPRSQFTNF